MIKTIIADITKLDVDAIVNAANERMLGGGGVDGAIHRAAGKELFEYCYANIPEIDPGIRCYTGNSVITPGFNLPAKFIIHTVGPVWGDDSEFVSDMLLGNCYKNSLQLAKNNNCNSIAFPAISTGVYGFPITRACKIAVGECKKFLQDNDIEIYLVAFKESDKLELDKFL